VTRPAALEVDVADAGPVVALAGLRPEELRVPALVAIDPEEDALDVATRQVEDLLATVSLVFEQGADLVEG